MKSLKELLETPVTEWLGNKHQFDAPVDEDEINVRKAEEAQEEFTAKEKEDLSYLAGPVY